MNRWRARARCKGMSGLMFDPDQTGLARTVCADCPVRAECLGFALDQEIDAGVWAGTTFAERTRLCPICKGPKEPSELGCNSRHSLMRLRRLIEQERAGDPTVSVTRRGRVSAHTTPGCATPRGRSHSTAKAYREGCRCEAARLALYAERNARPAPLPMPRRTPRERFMGLIDQVDGHWVWRGGVNGSGQGNFWLEGRTVRAHIYAFQEFGGPAADWTRLSPTCKQERCVNPEHYAVAA